MNRLVYLLVLSLGLWAFDGAMAAPLPVSQATRIEAGFSPDGSAEALVLRAIHEAHSSIHMAAYSFTAAPVVKALVAAKKRGVAVSLAVDEKQNLLDDRSGKSRAALQALVTAGIAVRVVSAYALQHSKYMVIDEAHVQTGSYNYSTSAARLNAENVLLIWDRPDLAQAYLQNWHQLFDAARVLQSSY